MTLEEEIKQLRAENNRLKAENKLYAAEMSAAKENGFYSAQELFMAYQNAEEELAEAKKDAGRYREWRYRFREGECELFNALADCATDEEHDAAIDAARAKEGGSE